MGILFNLLQDKPISSYAATLNFGHILENSKEVVDENLVPQIDLILSQLERHLDSQDEDEEEDACSQFSEDDHTGVDEHDDYVDEVNLTFYPRSDYECSSKILLI